MKEEILDILLKLFAIISKEEGGKEEELKVIEQFLADQLSENSVPVYYLRFVRYLQKGVEETVQALCARANRELTQAQKLFVITRLIELVLADGKISSNEQHLIEEIAFELNLPLSYVSDVINFINDPFPTPVKGEIRYIAPEATPDIPDPILIPNIRTTIKVLHFRGTNAFLLLYDRGQDRIQINGRLLLPKQIQVIGPGSIIHFKRGQVLYYSDIYNAFYRSQNEGYLVQFVVENVSYRFPNGQIGVHPLSFTAVSGEMIAIMGASGAGKSTLLNLLNGLKKPTSGKILLNGLDIHQEPESVKSLIGYVPQDDLLIEELTVYENLYYNAKLCFGDKSDREIRERVERTLKDLGLYEIRDLRVGSPLKQWISGGQRKRLNIALELIREPTVLFLDEPTSGLSSQDSEIVIDLLKQLSRRGKLVFVVIHQPSSDIYTQFDKLLLLDKGGYLAFYGNPIEAISYFRKSAEMVDYHSVACRECGNVDPDELFEILEAQLINEDGMPTGERKFPPEFWYKKFQEEQQRKQPSPPSPAEIEIPVSKYRVANPLKQLWIFFIRDFKAKLNNPAYLLITLSASPFLAFFLSALLRFHPYGKEYTLLENLNLPIYLFISVIVSLFLGMILSAEEIIKDRKIRKREHFLNLSYNSYLLGKCLVLMIFGAIQVASFIGIGHAIMGLKEFYLAHFGILFVTSLFAIILGLNISALFDSAVTAYISIPILLIPQIILSGVMVDYRQLNPRYSNQKYVPLIGDLLTARWAFEALAVITFKDNHYERHFYELHRKQSEAAYYLHHWIPTMGTEIQHYLNERDTNAIHLIANEMHKLTFRFSDVDTALLEKPDLTDIKACAFYVSNVYQFLSKLKNFYQQQLRKSQEELDARIQAFPPDSLKVLKQRYHNAQLEQLVRNKNLPIQILRYENELIPIIDPIFRIPVDDGTFFAYRTPLYVPLKPILGYYFPTYQFNFAVILLLTFLFYLFLVFDLFRRMESGFTFLWFELRKRVWKK